MKVMVTGGSGIVGHYVIDEMVARGYAVLNADRVKPTDLSHSGTAGASRDVAAGLRGAWRDKVQFIQADITDYGQVVSSMEGCEAVVHLAAAPTNVGFTEEYVFATNTTSMWNVMRAAEQLGVQKVILGSSYNAIGAMGTAARWGGQVKPPQYLPIDEDHPTRAEEAYSVSKWVGEHVADAFARRNPHMQLASMRFNGMWDDERMRDLHTAPVKDPSERAAAFWTYLHIRDAARACWMALEAMWPGHQRFFLNARDTMLGISTMDAIAKVYPTVPMRRPLAGFEAPIETEKAKSQFGWEPLYSWRDPQFASE